VAPKTFQKIPPDDLIRLGNLPCKTRHKTSVAPLDSPEITRLCCNLLKIGFHVVTDLDSRSVDLVRQPIQGGEGRPPRA
jgi:hypothetical protein